MIQTSTPVPDARNSIEAECTNDSLSDEDESLYVSIRGRLNRLERSPSAEIIEAILKYSKSL